MQGAQLSLIGNPVKIGNGPAAVIGDEICFTPLLEESSWEGADNRSIRKSEDLPLILRMPCGDTGMQYHIREDQVNWVQPFKLSA